MSTQAESDSMIARLQAMAEGVVSEATSLALSETTPADPAAEHAPGGLSVRWISHDLSNPPEEPPVLIEGLLRAGELCVVGAPRAIGSLGRPRTLPSTRAG